MKIFKKLSKKIFCDFLHWHNGKGSVPKLDHPEGVNLHSICSRCDKAVMQDSQGGWFLE